MPLMATEKLLSADNKERPKDVTTPHVGMKLWRWNENRRVYGRDPETGRPTGSPIWREHWEPCEIIGETLRSWLVGSPYMKTWADMERKADKVAKKDFPGKYATSEEDIEKAAFVEGRFRLAEKVRYCTDYDTLKKVEAALNALSK